MWITSMWWLDPVDRMASSEVNERVDIEIETLMCSNGWWLSYSPPQTQLDFSTRFQEGQGKRLKINITHEDNSINRVGQQYI